MRGSCTFNEALAKRLDLIKPSRLMIDKFLKAHPPRFTPGIHELVDLLKRRDVGVYLVSGGFESIITPVAKELGIPIENVFANRLKFYYDGRFQRDV